MMKKAKWNYLKQTVNLVELVFVGFNFYLNNYLLYQEIGLADIERKEFIDTVEKIRMLEVICLFLLLGKAMYYL